MSTPKRTESYAKQFLEIAEHMEKHEKLVVHEKDYPHGLQLRRLIYGYKAAMKRERLFENYPRFMASSVAVKEDGTVIIECRDDSSYAQAIQVALDKAGEEK